MEFYETKKGKRRYFDSKIVYKRQMEWLYALQKGAELSSSIK
jgi:hypothetical protein